MNDYIFLSKYAVENVCYNSYFYNFTHVVPDFCYMPPGYEKFSGELSFKDKAMFSLSPQILMPNGKKLY